MSGTDSVVHGTNMPKKWFISIFVDILDSANWGGSSTQGQCNQFPKVAMQRRRRLCCTTSRYHPFFRTLLHHQAEPLWPIGIQRLIINAMSRLSPYKSLLYLRDTGREQAPDGDSKRQSWHRPASRLARQIWRVLIDRRSWQMVRVQYQKVCAAPKSLGACHVNAPPPLRTKLPVSVPPQATIGTQPARLNTNAAYRQRGGMDQH